ncbi:hypothetical protein FAM15333_001957 [Propionibacterium freudenreichii]|uniref:hypothetical protein n=2 Tax=Propionibacterium freudenreichii TaxID=1744 RepID=UPI002550F4CD|nr:hypothetical protein [Propionibacterium freudenreichii]MDK9647092.1 hypothetical protein [Propionibacterium freudenreichii]MDK9667171.1 hypothetical protein [Propionibacterium freudenreichii]
MSDTPRPSHDPRPKVTLRSVLIAIGVVLVVLIAGAIVVTTRNASTPDTNPSPVAPAPVSTTSSGEVASRAAMVEEEKLDSEHVVEFRATTNRPGFVVYRVTDGDGTRADMSQSWSHEARVKNLDGVFLKVKSLSGGDADAEVSCQILVDGQVWGSDSGSGRGAFSKCLLRG